jgi:hypothetical protein
MLCGSRQFGNAFGDDLKLADGLAAEDNRNEGANGGDGEERAQENRRRAVNGVIRNGASTPENMRPKDSPNMWPRPRSAVGNCSDR